MPKRLITMGQRWPWRSARGLALVLAAALLLLYGYALRISPNSLALRRSSYAFELLGPGHWAWIWMGSGALTLVGSVFRFDRWFFTLAASVLGAWALFYIVAWGEGNIRGNIGWLSAGFFCVFVGFIVLCSGWEDEVPGRAKGSRRGSVG